MCILMAEANWDMKGLTAVCFTILIYGSTINFGIGEGEGRDEAEIDEARE